MMQEKVSFAPEYKYYNKQVQGFWVFISPGAEEEDKNTIIVKDAEFI